ncbi:zinc finger, HIT-type containing 3 [Seminavis robusta]|uniref:Zinc finger, HIT-type containing 3 n=1 Tax=Seminavis robusta TaxID=568900 RepID=A0A9N8EXP3_9STRA|nr:zinc finger, HIT-type containing 3 [Seminavis robusta]|eukprot:Sro1916_g305240.1 zinc finger, HIT-type containing 3 (314) ;mRNA; r:16884-17825
MAEASSSSQQAPINRKRRPKNNWENRHGKSRRQVRPPSQSNNNAGNGKAAVVSKPVCSVCQKVESPKYKCPKCRSPYCSIQCCRDHKASGCKPNTATSNDVSNNPTNGNATTTTATTTTTLVATTPTSRYLAKEELLTAPPTKRTRNDDNSDDDDDLEEGWKITDEMKQALQQNAPWLRQELADVGLQQIITGIDGASNRIRKRNDTQTPQERLLTHTKLDNPQFSKFCDDLLVASGILQRNDNGIVLSMEEEESLQSSSSLGDANNNLPTLKPTAQKVPLQKDAEKDVAKDDDESSSDDTSSSDSSDDEEDH